MFDWPVGTPEDSKELWAELLSEFNLLDWLTFLGHALHITLGLAQQFSPSEEVLLSTTFASVLCQRF